MMKRDKKYLSLVLAAVMFLFIIPQNLLYAENHSAENRINREFLKDFGNDFTKVLVSPMNWRKKDFLNFSAVFASGLLLYAVDQDIQSWVQDNRSSSSENFFKFVTHFGDGGVLFGLIAASYATGEIFDNNSLRKTSLLCLESWVTSGIIAGGLKFIVGRARPGSGESSHDFHPFSSRSSFLSFPSGHAASAFAVAKTIADQSRKVYVDILAYSLATLVALSRVHNDRHWASDVFIGSAIGYFVAEKISSLNKNRDSTKVKLGFEFSRQRQALSLSISL